MYGGSQTLTSLGLDKPDDAAGIFIQPCVDASYQGIVLFLCIVTRDNAG